MVSTGVAMDEGMVYFDARLSRHYPTVEIRVADVCLRPENTVLLAGIARGLVETAAREWREGIEPVSVPSALLRLAGWKASCWVPKRTARRPRSPSSIRCCTTSARRWRTWETCIGWRT